MSVNTVYVVTGANKGIGLGLVKSLLARPSTIVVATVRNIEAATKLKAEELTVAQGSVLHVLELNLTVAPSPENLLTLLNTAAPDLDHVDVLINNAAFIPEMSLVSETSIDDLRGAFETNTFAPLMIFQAFWPLLQKSNTAPKVINITSSVGSIAEQEPMAGGAYGPSKAALNWITRALHQQNEASGLIAVALHPGWVQTDSGQFAADQWGYAAGPPQTLDESITGILSIVDGATRDKFSGKFVSYNGEYIAF